MKKRNNELKNVSEHDNEQLDVDVDADVNPDAVAVADVAVDDGTEAVFYDNFDLGNDESAPPSPLK